MKFNARNLEICEAKSSYTLSLRWEMPSNIDDVITASARFGDLVVRNGTRAAVRQWLFGKLRIEANQVLVTKLSHASSFDVVYSPIPDVQEKGVKIQLVRESSITGWAITISPTERRTPSLEQ